MPYLYKIKQNSNNKIRKIQLAILLLLQLSGTNKWKNIVLEYKFAIQIYPKEI